MTMEEPLDHQPDSLGSSVFLTSSAESIEHLVEYTQQRISMVQHEDEQQPRQRLPYESPPDFQPPNHSQLDIDERNNDHINHQSFSDNNSNGHQSTSHISSAFLAGGPKSLSGIAIRAFGLGIVLGLTSSLSIFLSTLTTLWRPAAFVALLSLFHFLEFWITARYNPSGANTSAFLLTSNGLAYNIAHTAALLECLISHYFELSFVSSWVPRQYQYFPLVLGAVLVLLGQITRSVAMAQAGPNFNHHVQTKRAAGHELVTGGIYAWLRHPSYFGFFWWGLGTQLLLGNTVCLLGYMVVLWNFFKGRIRVEEKYLLSFFGKDYEEYSARTWIGIPFIR